MKCVRCNGTGTEPDNRAIGESLKKLREDAGLTVRQMAELTGLSHSFLSQLENGQRNWRRSVMLRYRNAVKQYGDKQ